MPFLLLEKHDTPEAFHDCQIDLETAREQAIEQSDLKKKNSISYESVRIETIIFSNLVI